VNQLQAYNDSQIIDKQAEEKVETQVDNPKEVT
jgi:hypothetical protein